MSDNTHTIYYTNQFVKNFKAQCKEHKGFSKDFDMFLDTLFMGGCNPLAVPRLKCHYNIQKIRKFYCAELRSNKAYRIIFADYKNTYSFVECYAKNKKADMDYDRACIELEPLKDGTYDEKFIKHDRFNIPKSRFLLNKY